MPRITKKQILSSDYDDNLKYTYYGNLDFRDNLKLTKLPNNLKVKGYLDLEGCKNLVEIPNDLHVESYLDVSYCYGLKVIGDNIFITGGLHLRNNRSLEIFPKNIYVGGVVSLQALPKVKNIVVRHRLGEHGRNGFCLVINNEIRFILGCHNGNYDYTVERVTRKYGSTYNYVNTIHEMNEEMKTILRGE